MDELKECPHDDWTVGGGERIGIGTCAKCGKQLLLSGLLRNWKARIEREFAEFRQAQIEATKRNDDFLNV